MRPGHHALSLSFSLRRTKDEPTSRPQRYKLVLEERRRLLPPMPSSSLPRVLIADLPAPSFSFSHAGAESIKPLARAGTARLILRVLYLGEKSMSTDMLTRVQTLRARELARKEARREPGRRPESRVTGMQCRISPCSSERAKGDRAERNAHHEMQRRRHTRICVYTRDTHAQPSHESKLFVTGGGGQGQKEGGHTCLLTISGRSCRGSYRVALIRDMNLILL